MQDVEQMLEETLDQLKKLGVKRKDGKEMTNEDTVKLLGVMAGVFAEMGNIMQESFARLQNVFSKFSAKATELDMTLEYDVDAYVSQATDPSQFKNGK